MTTITKTFALALLVLTTACGATTVTASSRLEGGNGGPNLGPIVEARTPPNVEQPVYDRQPADHSAPMTRENPSFRIESDCWRCR
jgi:hypothetical protein